MPHRVTQYQPTPNPNALKCTVVPPLPEPARSFRSRADMGGDALAAALFAVPGVAGLLINGDWMTVNKSPEADWAAVKKGVQEALAGL